MWLAAGPSMELIRFAQILAWIILPVLLLTIAVTTFLHYRRRKKINANAIADPEDAENNFILASPEHFNHSIKDGEYVYFDHSGLIREYKNRMFYNHARYAALRKDYAVLEAKYSSLSDAGIKSHKRKSWAFPGISSKKLKTDYMKNHNNEQISPADNTILAGDYVSDHKELSDKLQQLSRAYQRLEQENRFLQEQVSLQTATDDERNKIVERWKEEYGVLMSKLTERDYLEELLEEKKAQIGFLQNQLEQRIKNQHQADQQRQQAITELQQQKGEVDKVHAYFENVLRETKEKNELLNAEVADQKDEITVLKQQVLDERSKLQFVEQRLAANKQMLHRLHKEFASCIEEENDKSLVVELNQKIS